MRVALAQINTTVGDLKGNSRKILQVCAQARKQQCDIIVFPELTVSGYPPEDLLLKEHFIQENVRALRAITHKITGLTAIVGFVDREAKGRLYNAAAVVANRKVLAVYHKQELPNYGVFDEKRYFQPGQIMPLFAWNGCCLAVNICEDIWTDDGVYSRQAHAGASVIFNLSSSPYDYGKRAQRVRLLKRRARESALCVVYVNLVGGQDELVFDGGSLVISPEGKIIASGAQFAEDLVICDLDPVARRRRHPSWIPVPVVSPQPPTSPRRRPIAQDYSVLERSYRALVLGTKDYIEKNYFRKVLIGISGGIDSAVVAAIACAAVGKENVIGVSMPSRHTSEGTRSDARKVAHNLGMTFWEIPIEDVFESYMRTVTDVFTGTSPNVAEENIQARIRGNILMALSNKFDWLVLTTGNKSELAVGYCTLYGDMSGGFAVIKDVPKTMVYALARWINEHQSQPIPTSVLERAPSAELRPDQSDQDTLPPYSELDQLLQLYVEKHQSMAHMRRVGTSLERIKEVIRMVDRSEYKRRQSPPGIKITPRAFGKDWRLPITNKYKEF